MEAARSEGDGLIADYVDCLMSLDTNARSVQSDNLILGGPVIEAGIAASVGGIMEQDAMKDFVPPEDPKEPLLGMTFESDEAAKTFYNEYARHLGFPFRVGRSRRSKGAEEVVVMRRCAEKGSGSETVYKAAKDILQKAYEEIITYERNPARISQRDAININEDVMVDDSMTDQSLPDSRQKVTNLLGQFLGSSWSP
ncbi:hypothetical protein ZWY2020_046853 [Hordeum vulgare]|nr:hypothetical protein ZWY2020_046853 [Hordeum vulgare]